MNKMKRIDGKPFSFLGRSLLIGAAFAGLMCTTAACAHAATATTENPVTRSAANSQEPIAVVNQLFEALQAGEKPKELAKFFDESIDWNIEGDTANVPWIGRRTGRAGIEDFYTLMFANLKLERFEVTDTFTKGDKVLMLGSLDSRYLGNGELITTDFAYEIVVRDGLIVKYHMLEDSFGISEVVRRK
ncbi:nuclear transport factor 2 family protein [Qipengyuania sp. GH1]|uniref:nuclear transport factor 2 family protein n=1 Tax=Qipengyuania aestuarii TaxID=2867241 RepID=UPI001C87105C|nr:nuclear transport factor 2 family protein [Qipengyuania aestuarii]MBX7535170.1 nuclear transport factor 2 family protein [Qipengyuania aestuarii]